MERIGETLSKMRLDKVLAEIAVEPAVELPAPACSRCQDAGFLRRDVPVGHADFGKLVACICRSQGVQQRTRERLARLSNLGPLTRLTFETLVRDGRSTDPTKMTHFRRAAERAEAFAAAPEGWLVLVGPSGCGKTHLAAAITNVRLDRAEKAMFCVVPDLLDHLRATFSPNSDIAYDEMFEQVRNAPLLVLDDLGTQSSTPWAQEKLFQVLNHRYNARLATVVTTNHRLDELDERLRFRLSDPGLSAVLLVEEWEQTDLQRLGGLVHQRLREMTFDAFNPRGMNASANERDILHTALDQARGFAAAPEGWLVLLGQPGTGKTHLAASIANQRLAEGHQAYFVVVPDFLDYLRATYGPDSSVSYDKLFEAIRSAPLLVLDDLGAHSGTPWAQEKLYQLLNFRYNAKLPTVITTNLTWEQIEPRLRSRMLDERLSTTLKIQAPPYRSGDLQPGRSRDAAPDPRAARAPRRPARGG
jgi:DNA replication protein DnaC